MELILIRHGLPVRDDTSSDPPLAIDGVDQASRVARWLIKEKIDAVYASTMKRAIETAEHFLALSGHELVTHEGIVEFDRETGAYIPMEELKRTDYEAWKRMASGDHGIDIESFSKSVVETLEGIIKDNPGKRVAVFCHGGVINVWTAHVLGMPPRLFFEPVYTSVHRYMCASTGQRNIVSLNERHHLHID